VAPRPARRRWRAGTLGLALLLAGAVVGSGAPARATGRPGGQDPPSATASACPAPADPRPPSGPVAAAVRAQDARDGRPRVDLVRYPRPSSPGDPWSQWGQGLVLRDGRFLSAIGNHLGKDGNSYLYVYDPEREELAQFADVRSAARDTLDWGYGKVHGQIVPGPCGDAYVATYWGTRTGLAYTDRYRGDLLLRIDPDALTIEPVGVPVPGQGIPSLAGVPDGSIVYGEGVDPVASTRARREVGTFFAYDPVRREVVSRDSRQEHVGYRNVLVDADGNAYVAAAAGRLLRYDRDAATLSDAGVQLPGRGWLRASTAPGPDGTVYGVTTAPDRFFALARDGTVTDLGPAPAYTTSLALAPDGSRVYFVPDAHGGAVASGTPLMALDPATREITTVARLDDLTSATLGLRAGGSYDVVIDPAGTRLYVGLNAGRDAQEPWGEVVLAVVHLGDRARSDTTTPPTAKQPRAAQCRTGRPRLVYTAVPPGSRAGGLRVEDVTAAWGAEAPLTGMRAHAVATGDVNGDGWTDVFVGTFADRPAGEYRQRGASGPAPDRLLLGGPGGFRVDPAFPGERGRTSGAAFGDFDGDGDPDLVVARNVRAGPSVARTPTVVYRNDAGTLVKAATIAEPAGARSVGLLDYDADGRLDLFIAEDRFAGGSSVLLRNVGGFAFADVTAGTGIPEGVAGMGVGTADLDADGRPDLFVGGANRLFLNRGGRFSEQVGAVPAWPRYGDEDDPAGVAEGDVNGDGRLDVVIGQHYNSTVDGGRRVPIRLYLNEPDRGGGIRLRDVTEAAGLVGLPTKSPHVEIADLDADGRPDIVTSAAGADGTTPLVFRNVRAAGGEPRFETSSSPGSAQYWVAGATFDADHDGRLDVLLAEWEPARPSVVLRNTGRTGHWLAVSGPPGTVVEVFPAGRSGDASARIATATVGASTGYSSGPPDHVWVGLGDLTRVDVRIAPPRAKPAELRNQRTDRSLGPCRISGA